MGYTLSVVYEGRVINCCMVVNYSGQNLIFELLQYVYHKLRHSLAIKKKKKNLCRLLYKLNRSRQCLCANGDILMDPKIAAD